MFSVQGLKTLTEQLDMGENNSFSLNLFLKSFLLILNLFSKFLPSVIYSRDLENGK